VTTVIRFSAFDKEPTRIEWPPALVSGVTAMTACISVKVIVDARTEIILFIKMC
jgi:hypothetical protein